MFLCQPHTLTRSDRCHGYGIPMPSNARFPKELAEGGSGNYCLI
ncbi:Uncharacterized protein dnm_062760 [Desulfonema magnum]|uniref:Uncharacterized protein n=1 Tax=Desulfonema magnum TaxID=45655 RepID=A0A975BRF7_9BACT|nr:Uncharacterized protein dnm_062760 [Desulfonema magnum]